MCLSWTTSFCESQCGDNAFRCFAGHRRIDILVWGRGSGDRRNGDDRPAEPDHRGAVGGVGTGAGDVGAAGGFSGVLIIRHFTMVLAALTFFGSAPKLALRSAF